MDKFKAVMKKIFVLKPFQTVVIAFPSFVIVFVVLMNPKINPVIAYATYVYSAYGFIIAITGFKSIVNAIKTGFWNLHPIKAIAKTKIGERFFNSRIFRSAVSLHQGLFMNVIYVAVKLATGIIYHSVWLIALGSYYLLLAVMRSVLVFNVHRLLRAGKRIGDDEYAEYKSYRMCGIVLAVMNQALACIVIYIVYGNQGMNYPGLLIYAMAVYAFYAVISAIVNLVRFRRQGSPLISAANVISLTAALVSMLSLETAMLAEFGAEQVEFRKIMTSISGGVVCTFVLGMSVYMIWKSTKYLKIGMQQEV
jgi:hypothetical protein